MYVRLPLGSFPFDTSKDKGSWTGQQGQKTEHFGELIARSTALNSRRGQQGKPERENTAKSDTWYKHFFPTCNLDLPLEPDRRQDLKESAPHCEAVSTRILTRQSMNWSWQLFQSASRIRLGEGPTGESKPWAKGSRRVFTESALLPRLWPRLVTCGRCP